MTDVQTPLSTARDRVATGLAVVFGVGAVAAAVVAVLFVVAPAFAADLAVAWFAAGWPNALVWALLALMGVAFATASWRSRTAVVLIDERGIRRATSAAPSRADADAEWFVPSDDIATAEILTVRGRPYLTVTRCRSVATSRGASSRFLLWGKVPRGAVVAPLDRRAVPAVEGALAELRR